MLFSPVKMPQSWHCLPFAAYGLTEHELTMSNPKVRVQPYKVFWAIFVVCSSESLRDSSGVRGLCLRANDHSSLWLNIQAAFALSPPLPFLPWRLRSHSKQWLPAPDTREHLALTQPGAAPTGTPGQRGKQQGGWETLLQHYSALASFISQALCFLPLQVSSWVQMKSERAVPVASVGNRISPEVVKLPPEILTKGKCTQPCNSLVSH